MAARHIKPAFCRFEPTHLFDGLFVPTKGRKRPKLEVKPRQFGDLEISFQGFDQLGADDQSILLAISAQLGIDGLTIENEGNSGGEISKQLWLDLKMEGETAGATSRTKKTTLYSLMADAGYENKKSTAFARQSLNRLRNAQVREVNRATGWDRACNLISTHFNRITGETFIAANPRLSASLFHGQHIRISLYERNKLETECAKILHCWLSSNIKLGHPIGNGNGVRVESLIPHVYGPVEPSSKKVLSIRRGKVKEALDEISDKTADLHSRGQGWVIDSTSSGLTLISRPKQIPLVEGVKNSIDELIDRGRRSS